MALDRAAEMNRRRHMSPIGRHSSPPLTLFMAAGQPESTTDIQKAIREYTWKLGQPSKPNAAVFNNIPAAFLPYIPEISECPICFKKGFIKRLTQKKKSIQGNWYQQCETKRHFFMHPSDLESEQSNSPERSHRTSDFHPSSPLRHLPSLSAPQPRKGDECIVPGCHKKQQANNCSNCRCSEHCIALARQKEEEDGTGEAVCDNSSHKTAIRKVIQALTVDPPTHNSNGKATQRASNSHVAEIISSSGKAYKMPFGIPVGADGSDVYDQVSSSRTKQSAFLNAQVRFQATQESHDERLRFEVWYWIASKQRSTNRKVPLQYYMTQKTMSHRWKLGDDQFLSELFGPAPFSYFDTQNSRWILISPALSIHIGNQSCLLIRENALAEGDCEKMEESMRKIALGRVEEERTAVPLPIRPKVKAEHPPASIPPSKRRKFSKHDTIPIPKPAPPSPIKLVSSSSEDEDSNSSSSSTVPESSLSWWSRNDVKSTILGLERMEKLRNTTNPKTGKMYLREDAFRKVFGSREWKVPTWQRQDAVRQELTKEEREIWLKEKGTRPWSAIYDELSKQGRSSAWNDRRKKQEREVSKKEKGKTRKRRKKTAVDVEVKSEFIEPIDLTYSTDEGDETLKKKELKKVKKEVIEHHNLTPFHFNVKLEPPKASPSLSRPYLPSDTIDLTTSTDEDVEMNPKPPLSRHGQTATAPSSSNQSGTAVQSPTLPSHEQAPTSLPPQHHLSFEASMQVDGVKAPVPPPVDNDEFLAQLAAASTQVHDNDQDDDRYLSRSLHLCIKHGCPFCHRPFPQSPSLLLAILVDDAAESWVECITTEGFVVYFPESQESTLDLQEQICSTHAEEANDERLKQLGMSCPIRNPECHAPSPSNPSPGLQAMLLRYKRLKKSDWDLQLQICDRHSLESKIDNALRFSWPILLDSSRIHSELQLLQPQLLQYIRDPYGYYWEQFTRDREQGLIGQTASTFQILPSNYAVGYYGHGGLDIICEWLSENFDQGRHFPQRLLIKMSPVPFMILALARHAISLLVSSEMGLKPDSMEMRDLLRESEPLGDIINAVDIHPNDSSHWRKQLHLQQQELGLPMPAWLLPIEIAADAASN